MKFLKEVVFLKVKTQHSFCYKIHGLLIDILIEEEQERPENLLVYVCGDIVLHVQSVKAVIDAKRKYVYASETGAGYVRKKDVDDFFALKGANFNL